VFTGQFPLLNAPVGPDLGVGSAIAGDLDVPGWVAVDQPVANREIEGGAQGGTQMVERRRGLRLAFGVGCLRDGEEDRAQ
jgi:hypothetical protein